MGEPWPPPVMPKTVWRSVFVGLRADAREVRVREVRLWGKNVLIDEAGNVYCPGCGSMVPVAEVGRRGNEHSLISPWGVSRAIETWSGDGGAVA